jgi:uncharacterized protein YecE (DUF72 family)
VSDLRIGCSGFMYDHWKGNFYPDDISKNRWFDYYCNNFTTVELNVTFYRLPERENFSKWYALAPENFVFSLKGSKFITHVKKLKDCSEPLEAFFSRALMLKEKLGVILWQMPPTFNTDPERLKVFLEMIEPYGVRNAFEFRNKTWINKKNFSILEKYNAVLCIADYPEYLSKLPVTADFVYIRRHGKNGNHLTCYSIEELKEDAKFIKSCLRKKKDVFIYFNNDAHGYAPKNALELSELLKTKK